MPTSYLYQLNTIVELIIFANPIRVLDVGIGFGKYGFLCREYLGMREDEKYTKRHIEGIEAFEGYLSPINELIYDSIHLGDAAKIVPNLKERFDLILLIDVLEHLRFEEGKELMMSCQELGKNLIISTPKRFHPQQEVFGNPYEVHLSHWKRHHFRFLSDYWIVPHRLSWICFSGEDRQQVEWAVKRHHSYMTRVFLSEQAKRPLRFIRDLFTG